LFFRNFCFFPAVLYRKTHQTKVDISFAALPDSQAVVISLNGMTLESDRVYNPRNPCVVDGVKVTVEELVEVEDNHGVGEIILSTEIRVVRAQAEKHGDAAFAMKKVRLP